MAKDAPPTEAEIKAAESVMARAAMARQAEADAKIQPVRDITSSPAFAEVREKIEALPLDFMADMTIAPFIMALKSGFNGLASVAPPPAPEAQPAPAGGTTGREDA